MAPGRNTQRATQELVMTPQIDRGVSCSNSVFKPSPPINLLTSLAEIQLAQEGKCAITHESGVELSTGNMVGAFQGEPIEMEHASVLRPNYWFSPNLRALALGIPDSRCAAYPRSFLTARWQVRRA